MKYNVAKASYDYNRNIKSNSSRTIIIQLARKANQALRIVKCWSPVSIIKFWNGLVTAWANQEHIL